MRLLIMPFVHLNIYFGVYGLSFCSSSFDFCWLWWWIEKFTSPGYSLMKFKMQRTIDFRPDKFTVLGVSARHFLWSLAASQFNRKPQVCENQLKNLETAGPEMDPSHRNGRDFLFLIMLSLSGLIMTFWSGIIDTSLSREPESISHRYTITFNGKGFSFSW